MFFRVLAVALVALGGSASAQDKDKKDNKATVYRNVSTQKLEGILEDLKIDFNKTEGKSKGIWFYDFERNNFKVRLHSYQGRDLWVDVVFTDKISLKEINAWNVRAKFSRAVQVKTDDRVTTPSNSRGCSWSTSSEPCRPEARGRRCEASRMTGVANPSSVRRLSAAWLAGEPAAFARWPGQLLQTIRARTPHGRDAGRR